MGCFSGRIDHLDSPPDAAIARLADAQHGVVARWQLVVAGIGVDAINFRRRVGRLHRLYPGVYAVGHTRLSLRARWMAAVLACGEGAVLSHYDAGRLWGILSGGYGPIHVTARRSRVGHEGIELHRSRQLDPRDHGRLHGIPVTGLARTLLDLAEVLSPRRLGRAIEEAERLRLFNLAEIHATIERNRGRHGARSLLAGCGTALEEARHTKSEFERGLLDGCREIGIPLPAMNVMIEDEMVDAHWPGTKVIVELQSWEWHRTRQALERDSTKTLKLQAAGFTVVPLTWRQLTTGRRTTLRRLEALLAAYGVR